MIDFISALKIAESVFDQYKVDQPKWWKKLDGTPMLNDLAVLMAEAFVEHEQQKTESSKPRCLKNEDCDCDTFCGDDRPCAKQAEGGE